MDISEQINILRELKNGWLDGEGTSYQESDLKKVESYLINMINLFKYLDDKLYIYPKVEGNIVVELDEKDYTYIINFELKEDIVRATKFNASNDFEEAELICFISDNSASEIVDFLKGNIEND